MAAASSQYNHQQTTPSATWTIAHNLGTSYVSTDCVIDFNGGREKILPLNVTITDDNQIVVTFSNAETGSCRVVGN